jgi:hypothetical protein
MAMRLRSSTDIEVRRGRDASGRIADMVRDEQAKGREVLSVTVSRNVADCMKAYFASFTQFDGVLPKTCHGAPFYIDLGANEDYVIRSRMKAN